MYEKPAHASQRSHSLSIRRVVPAEPGTMPTRLLIVSHTYRLDHNDKLAKKVFLR